MNAQKGLTARKGGANDPSVIQNKLKAGQAAYNPSSSGVPATTTLKTSPASNQSTQAGQAARSAYGSTQSVATSLATSKPAQASGSDITDKATYDTKTTKPAPFQPGPSSVKLSPEPQKFSGNAEGPAPAPAAPEPKQYPQTRIGGNMAIQDLANKAAESPATNINKDSSVDDIVKALSPKKQNVQESVQVGDNKYRIV